jgi:serine/threonine protein kinase
MVEQKPGEEKAPDNMFNDANKGEIKKVYHFEQKLANGAFGQVYLAQHRTSNEKFAIKVI